MVRLLGVLVSVKYWWRSFDHVVVVGTGTAGKREHHVPPRVGEDSEDCEFIGVWCLEHKDYRGLVAGIEGAAVCELKTRK